MERITEQQAHALVDWLYELDLQLPKANMLGKVMAQALHWYANDKTPSEAAERICAMRKW